MTLDGKGAVITGGGLGIGAAVARALAEAGAAVVVAARTQSQIDEVAGELGGDGHRAWAVPCDVTDPGSVNEMSRAANEHLEHVDILVNNAGVASSAPVQKIDLDEWNRLFAINVTGTLLCTQAFVGDMVERGWGRIVNLASIAGLTGSRYIAAYSASKHAMVGFTRCVAAEVAGASVTVNAICPGYVDTPMTDRSIENIAAKTGLSEEQALAAILETTPQRRLIESDEVAHAVLSLCDEKAKGINGQTIVIDGGELLS